MAKWWEELLDQPVPSAAPTSRLARDQDFFERQQAAEDELFRRDRADDSQSQRALNQSGAQLRATVPAVTGLARTLIGDEQGGQADLRKARDIIDREAEFAPDIQNVEDVHGVGDALAYGRNAVLSNLPTILPTIGSAIATGGLSAVGGAALRGVAKKGLGRAIGKALTYKTGQAVGALAGSSALQSTQVLDAALDESGGDSARSRAAKAVVGAVTTGALDALPEISLLNRIGLGGAAKRAIAPEITASLRKRIATEAGKQALQEGTTEAIQSLGENLTHKWVNDNVDVVGPKAYSEYLNSFVAGGLVGGVLGPTAAIRGGGPKTESQPNARDKVKGTFQWFTKKDQAPRPAGDFEKTPAPEPPAGGPPSAGGASLDLAKTLSSATDTLKAGTDKAMGAVGKLFGKYHADFKDEDFNSDFDAMLERFRVADKYGKATNEDRGIIGQTHNDGVVRGDVPFNGFSLFNPDQAESIWETGRKSGKPVSTFQAFALSALDPTQVEGLGKEPIKAAALYLATGDRSAVNEDALADYLKALPSSDQQIQFLFAADRISEMVKRGREASGPTEITPKDLRKMVPGNADPLRTNVDAEDKTNFDLRSALSDNPDGEGSFADFQQQQAMDEDKGPQPIALHETISAKDFSKMSFGDHAPVAADGEVAAVNSKGNRRTVKLASLVARGWQEVRNGTFDAPNGVVDVVAQAIDTIRQKGMNVAPEAIKPGLWLGGETYLTPAQAKAIRQGMQTTEAQRPPVQETPGLPNVPVANETRLERGKRILAGQSDRPFDASTLEGPSEEVQGEDGVENMTGDEASVLKARTRSPQGLRVDVQDEGESAPPVMTAQKTNPNTGTVYQKFAPEQVVRPAKVAVREGETLDTEAGDNVSDDQRKAETDAIEAMHRANAVISPGTKLKGGNLQQLMDNFGKRVKALKAPTKEQKTAIDGARRAIQRIERNTDAGLGGAAKPLPESDKGLKGKRRNIADMVPHVPALERVGENGEKGIRAIVDVNNDLDFSVDDLIEDSGSEIDLAREQKMLNALTARLGIAPITVRPLLHNHAFGQYSPSTRTIYLSAKRKGNARLDTMLHELGHAVVLDTYDNLSEAEQQALIDAHRAWVMEHYKNGTELGIRNSRAPFFLKKWLDENRPGAGRPLSELTDEQIEYVLSFDEFLADHLSRALGKNAQTQGIIGKFFSDLAAKLRELYQAFTGSKYEPAESVEAWVNSLLQGQMAQVINAQPVERQHALAGDLTSSGVLGSKEELEELANIDPEMIDFAYTNIQEALGDSVRSNPVADSWLRGVLNNQTELARLKESVRRTNSESGLFRLMLSVQNIAPENYYLKGYLLGALQVHKFRLFGASEAGVPGRPSEEGAFSTQWNEFLGNNYVGTTKNVAELARRLLNGKQSLNDRQRRLLSIFANSSVLYTTKLGVSANPMYMPGEHTIYLPDSNVFAEISGVVTSLHPVDVFLHEATHALTWRGEAGNTEVRKDLSRLLEHVREHAKKTSYPIDVMYGMTNTQEFLAEAFSNPHFQEILSKIPALNTNTFKNAWEEFKSMVAHILGLDPKSKRDMTALDEALTLGIVAGKSSLSFLPDETRSAMDRLGEFIRRMTGNNDTSRLVASGIVNPPPIQPNQAGPGATPSNLFYLLNKVDRTRLEKVLREPKVAEQIYQAANAAQRKQLDIYGNDLETLINLGAALHAQGRLDINNVAPLTKLINFVKKMLGLASNQDVARQIFADHAAQQIRRGRYDAEKLAFGRNEYTRTVLAVQRAVRNTVTPVMDRLTQDVGTRMRESMVPALRKAASLFETRVGENVGEQSYVSTHQQFFSELANKYMEAVGPLKDDAKRQVARALQANVRPAEAQLAAAYDRVQGLYKEMFNWARAHRVDIKFRRDYFPIVMDRKRIEDNWAGMKALLAKPEYEADIRAFFRDQQTDLDTLLDRMVQIAQTADASHVGEVEFALGVYEPSMNAQRAQIMGFLTQADRAALAEFQIDSLDAITLGYISQLAKKAAFVRTFGKIGRDQNGQPLANRLGQLRAAAQRQGATQKDTKLFDDFAKMMLGSYHAELNPSIRWLFSKVDKVFDKNLEDMSIEEWAHYQQVAMTYNNFRLLGLAPLSSLIDSLGTLARGGNLTDATKSIWDGIRGMRNNGNDLREQAQALEIIEKYALSDALAATYGGQFDPQGKLGRLNNALFKYNGLEAITRHSRLAALAMGHRFLLRHALNPTKHSARLLKDLQLTAADIQPDPTNPKFAQMTPKVEQALRRFVFESVVRPQPSQRPGWHNDPNFQFAAQYKGYLYAFYTTIVNRMVHEAQQGNYSAAIMPLVPYLGVTVAAEMLRYAIQHPGEDDPRDAEDYMKLAAIRSGLVGPRFGVFHDARTDTRYGSWATNSWVGPTGQQVSDLVETATGKRSFGRTAVEALPGSAIFEDWTWGPKETSDDSAAVAAQ